MPLDVVPWGIVIAALGGLAIGVEREWSGHASGLRRTTATGLAALALALGVSLAVGAW